MKCKLFSALLITFLFSSSIFTQEEVKTIVVEKNIEITDSFSFPVFGSVKRVEVSDLGGIKYMVTAFSDREIMKKVEAIKIFYVGKKMGIASLPKFKLVSKPETIAWISLNPGTNGEGGAQVILIVEEKTVVAYVLDNITKSDLGSFNITRY